MRTERSGFSTSPAISAALRRAVLVSAMSALAVVGAHGARAQGIVPAPVGGKASPALPAEERHALLIGNSAYDGVSWRALPGVRYDIEAVSEALESHGYDVQTAENLKAADMRRTIERFIKQKAQKKDASVVVYYAGHGVSVENDAGVEMGYLVPVDAPNPARDSVDVFEDLLPMFDFGSFAIRMQARHALFLFDACFAGTIFKDLGLERDDTPPPAVSDLLERPARSVITSGSTGQKVPDESAFRRYLVDALNGDLGDFGDGYITGAELGAELRARVMNTSGTDQRPQFGKLDLAGLADGDFVFSLRDAKQDGAVVREFRKLVDQMRDLSPMLKKPNPSQKAVYGFMTLVYENALDYDSRADVSAADKAEIWNVFLDHFSEDLDEYTDDDQLRERAILRIDALKKPAGRKA